MPPQLPNDFAEIECVAALLPQYDFLQPLGQGGMGSVYLARQPTLDRLIAVKILSAQVADQSAFAQQFKLEARSMARLIHPNIVAVFESGQTSIGQLYYVMEYVHGHSLHTLIQKHALREQSIPSIIAQLCEALQYAHEHGVIHRDIKPANILITAEGHVKVVDFGLALQMGAGGVIEDYGTPDYASPERLSGNADVDHRADLYSVGAVLHEMLTGKTPAAADALGEVHALPEPYAAVVSRCLMADPERRYYDAKALKAEIIAPRSLPAPRMNNYTSTIPVHRAANRIPEDKVSSVSITPAKQIGYLWAAVAVLGLAVLILSYLLVQHWGQH